jgi:flagellar hook-length control protein FliK
MSEITKTVDPMAVTARSGTEYPSGNGTQQAMTAVPGGASVALGQDVAAAPDSFANLFQAHMDETGSQVSYWSAQGAQRANFTVGSAQDMPVEVTLSFVDGTLEVAFETEEQGVRELLENHAHEALQLLMEAQGIVLGGVSVGGGRPHAQRDTGAGNSTVDLSARGRGRKVEPLADPVASVARRTPETMTANKLDLYA